MAASPGFRGDTRAGLETRREKITSTCSRLNSEALLLGLEIMVLADVIETITVTPTFESLALLAAIVMVRTAVSWTLTLETEGRWPWQAPTEDQNHA